MEAPDDPDDRPRLVLVLGGARSGKSRFAEALAARAGRPVLYVATAQDRGDPEMAERIRAHRRDRPAHWRTVEIETDLATPLAEPPLPPGGIVLVDCLTLWLTSVMVADPEPDATAVAAAIDRLAAALARRARPTVLVSNEVGDGIVPATRLGRRFRDHQGRLNQVAAALSTDVVRLVAGCPVTVKPAPEPDIRL